MISFSEYTLSKILGDKVFIWATSRPKNNQCSQKVRFTPQEFERSIKPRLFFGH